MGMGVKKAKRLAGGCSVLEWRHPRRYEDHNLAISREATYSGSMMLPK